MARQSFFPVVVLFLMSLNRSLLVQAADGKYSFVTNSSLAATHKEYDYIIVGGGTSGCPLASTLSQNFTVLLLERGGAPFGNPNVENTLNFAEVLTDINDTTITPAEGFMSEDGVLNRRARVLGGGTCINAGFYSRAESEWITERGMNEGRVNESYEWVENVVASFPSIGIWQTAVKDGLLEIGITPDNGNTYEHLVGTKVGGTIFDSEGNRRTAADLLQYANPDNIDVLLYATAHQITFDLNEATGGVPRATGILYTDEQGRGHQATLKASIGSELILAAGAIGSPQLLMLSGVGPSRHLQEFDIPIVLDQPAVGQNMADNPCVTMLVPSRLPLETSLIATVGILSTGFFIEAASGSVSAFDEVQSLNTLDPDYRTQDLVANFSRAVALFPDEARNGIAQSGMLLGKLASPVSRGELKLNSSDVRHSPRVLFNYFSDPQDMYACVEGVRTMLQLLKSTPFTNITYATLPESVLAYSGFVAPLVPPTNEAALLSQWCRQTLVTIWHFHGGCQEGVVVDQAYKVLGVDALRVIDGSTFNSSPGTNPQATVMMLGRYMGLQMLDERTNLAE